MQTGALLSQFNQTDYGNRGPQFRFFQAFLWKATSSERCLLGFDPKELARRQRTSQIKLNKLVAHHVMFVAMAGARFERQFLAAPSFFGLAMGFFLPL